MTPAQAIAMLDDQISRHGQTVTLRRLVPNGQPIEKTVRGFVRGYKADELTGGIQQGDSAVTLSPSALVGTPFEAALPRRLDKAETAGRERNIELADAVYMADVLVRINLQVRG